MSNSDLFEFLYGTKASKSFKWIDFQRGKSNEKERKIEIFMFLLNIICKALPKITSKQSHNIVKQDK
jgi:hypothetical protein